MPSARRTPSETRWDGIMGFLAGMNLTRWHTRIKPAPSKPEEKGRCIEAATEPAVERAAFGHTHSKS